MSVTLKTKQEVMKLAGELIQLPEVIDIVNADKTFNDLDKYQPYGIDPKNHLHRTLWYGYIANQVAYAVNYEEQPVIDYEYWEEDEPEKIDVNDKYKMIQIRNDLGSLLYNMATNNGTIFLQKEYLNLLNDVYKYLDHKLKHKEVEYPNYCY